MFVKGRGAYIEFKAAFSLNCNFETEKVLVKKPFLDKGVYEEKKKYYVQFKYIDILERESTFTWLCNSYTNCLEVFEDISKQLKEQKQSFVDEAFENALLGDKQ